MMYDDAKLGEAAKADGPDVSEGAQPKAVAKGPADVDAAPHSAVRDVVGLDCAVAQPGRLLMCVPCVRTTAQFVSGDPGDCQQDLLPVLQ